VGLDWGVPGTPLGYAPECADTVGTVLVPFTLLRYQRVTRASVVYVASVLVRDVSAAGERQDGQPTAEAASVVLSVGGRRHQRPPARLVQRHQTGAYLERSLH